MFIHPVFCWSSIWINKCNWITTTVRIGRTRFIICCQWINYIPSPNYRIIGPCAVIVLSQFFLQLLAVVKIFIISRHQDNQGMPWSEEEDNLLTQRFSEGTKITQLAKLHSRTYGAIKARLLKLELLQK